MSRPKLYANAAQRQQAYRQRQKTLSAGALKASPRPAKLTRPQRFKAALRALEDLSQEYQDWLEALPENLSQGEQASQLTETIDQLQESLALLESLELPRGFGR